MATPAPGQHVENGVNMVVDVIPVPVEEYGCSGICGNQFRFILILKRERKTLAVAQIMVSLVMLAFGIVMFEDSDKLYISTGLLYWAPLLCLVCGCLTAAVTNQPNTLLARLCVVANSLCAFVMVASGITILLTLDLTEIDCTPPEATLCQPEKFKALFRIRNNGIILALTVLVYFLSIMSINIVNSFRNPTFRVMLQAPSVNVYPQTGPVPNTTNEPHRSTFPKDYPEERPPH